jgi:hypothetical protein
LNWNIKKLIRRWPVLVDHYNQYTNETKYYKFIEWGHSL